MALLDTAVISLHLVFAGVWAGSVVFVTLAVLPSASDGSGTPESLKSMTNTLLSITRVSSLALLITGGHMAGTYYTVETLTGSTRGHLVVGMVVLWFVLTVLIEIGGRKLADGFSKDKVREPARAARPYLLTATVVALLLLVDGGLLASGFA